MNIGRFFCVKFFIFVGKTHSHHLKNVYEKYVTVILFDYFICEFFILSK